MATKKTTKKQTKPVAKKQTKKAPAKKVKVFQSTSTPSERSLLTRINAIHKQQLETLAVSEQILRELQELKAQGQAPAEQERE